MVFVDGLMTTMSNLGTVLFYGWPFLLLGLLWVNRLAWRRYPLEAIILEKRGDNLVKTNDRVGKFHDKAADMIEYRFKKTKDTIPVYNFDWVVHNVSVPTNLLEKYINIMQGNNGTVFLFRYGSKQYKPISIKPDDDKSKVKLVEHKDKRGDTVYSYQYVQFDPRYLTGLIDFEVIDWDNMNFMVQEQRASVLRRQRKGEFWKQTLIPLAIIAGAVIAGIFIMKFSYDAGADLRGLGYQSEISQQQSSTMGDSVVGNAIANSMTPGGNV